MAAAFERLRTSDRPYRNEATIIVGAEQTFQETAEFIPPDRMRKVTINRMRETTAHGIRIPAYETTSEVIRVGARAWEKEGTRWREWEAGLAQEIYGAGMDFWLLPERVVPADANFECLGLVEFKGATYIGYRAKLDKVFVAAFVRTPNDKEREELEARLQRMPQEWRTVLVDRWSGLPVYDLVAEENQLDKPRYKVEFRYSAAINIEPPAP